LKRLMEAYEWLQTQEIGVRRPESESRESEVDGNGDRELNKKVNGLLNELDHFINDDFNTAKVLANIFELIPVINSLKDSTIRMEAVSAATFQLLKTKLKTYVEDILGLKMEVAGGDDKMKGVMEVLIQLRKEARAKKDWATSDKIRNQLAEIGIQLKDEKNGNISWSLS
jgi:cysteinyl-tRNA synthetase